VAKNEEKSKKKKKKKPGSWMHLMSKRPGDATRGEGLPQTFTKKKMKGLGGGKGEGLIKFRHLNGKTARR